MPLISDANELKQYIFKNPTALENHWFILAHAPYCAKHISPQTPEGKIFMDVLNQMFQTHEYTIPFYYIGYLKFNSQHTSAADCKGFLRSMCNDLDRVTKWFEYNGINISNDPNYIKNISSVMTDYVKTFINGVRKKQLEVGANESAMLNYSPIIPYTYNMNRDHEFHSNPEVLNALEETVNQYEEFFDSDYNKRYEIISSIAMKNANEIIQYIDLPFYHWNCPMDIFMSYAPNNSKCSNDTLRYLTYIWLLNQDEDAKITVDKFRAQYHDFITFRKHSMIPLKKDEFNTVFESMCNYKTGELSDMMTVEAWSALAEDSQEMMDHFLKKVPKSDITDSTYDLDALLSEFYTMRHVETNDYTNQFFLAELSGININSYNYLNNDIMVCEINSKWLVIPYIDIACDYQMRIIGINKDNEITIWENFDELKESNN